MTWQKGQSGNPKGRPVGARQKLSDRFIRVLAKDFEENGVEAVQRVREEKPEQYLGTINKLMPKLMELSGPDGEDIPVSGTVRFVGTRKDD
jgi:hypothetical protein